MHVIQVATEFAACVKVGGLADVIFGLCRELKKNNEKVQILLPKYSFMNLPPKISKAAPLSFYFDGKQRHAELWEAEMDGLELKLIDSKEYNYFKRKECYGYSDDVERFSFFCAAASRYIMENNADLVHLHDWQTALVASLCKAHNHNIHTIFTIHNIEHQGLCSPADLDRVGLVGKDYLKPDLLQDRYKHWDINLMKGAIVFADQINTVSPTYAFEVQTEEGGRGLDQTLRKFNDKFSGILNGIDADYWNTQKDPFVRFSYKFNSLVEKKKNKRYLEQKLKMSESKMPMVACIARLVPQKGVELIKHALYSCLEKGAQFILLGSSPIESIEQEFKSLKEKFSTSPNIRIETGYQEELAHEIFAASDIFIVPSIFEPCGLTQRIALKYGSIPVVRKTGGLADTVFDLEYSEKDKIERNGFVFEHPTKEGLDFALDRAIDCYVKQASFWQELVKRGMKIDSSWKKPALEYKRLYQLSSALV